jgi:PAS domain S-box-containing protein
MLVAYVVLGVSLIPAGAVYFRVRASVEARERGRFERVVQEERAAIQKRIPNYIEEMMGVRGLFAAERSVSSDQWQKYVDSTANQTLFPGICTMGYLERVGADQQQAFLERLRVLSGTESAIQPAGDRPVYFPVVYLNRFETNLNEKVGRDHFASPERQPIMDMARDTGRSMSTGRVNFGPDGSSGKKDGFVVYLPVYRVGASTATVDDRRAALQGFIFANFESAILLSDILGEHHGSVVACEIFDGAEPAREDLLFDSASLLPASGKSPPRFAETVTLPMLNRTWTLRFSSLPSFEAESQQNLPIIALICWLTLGLLLFEITWAEVKARTRAEKINRDLQQSETALAAEKERLAVTLYSIGDGVITTDTAGCILSINKVGEELTGWSQAEALGKPLAELLNVVNESTRERCADLLETVLRTGMISSLERSAILIPRHGTESVIAQSAAPIRGRDGGTVGVVVVFRDITSQQKSEAQQLKESKLESVGLLAGGIAHDFNNILQGILGNLSLARMDAHSKEKVLERLAMMEKCAVRAKGLTQQLVMFARGGEPIRKRLKLTDIIKDATLSALRGANVPCEFSVPPSLWPVEADEGQFRQVIDNIVLNALQAMPDGGKIEVLSENVELAAGFIPPLAAGKYVKISVRDHGAGIRPEYLSRIFDPYFTTKGHARGLGLASAYSVVRKHDGQIMVESQVARGSTFHIYLPASLKVFEVMTVPDNEPKRFCGQGRVLIMDDEADILTLVSEMLGLMGYQVGVARDGAEALQWYSAARRAGNPFDVVVMDLTIPHGMGGKEAILRLKELDPQVKAIVSSGYSYDPVMSKFQEFGFSGVIPKPYVMEDLVRLLEEVIQQKGEPAGQVS